MEIGSQIALCELGIVLLRMWTVSSAQCERAFKQNGLQIIRTT